MLASIARCICICSTHAICVCMPIVMYLHVSLIIAYVEIQYISYSLLYIYTCSVDSDVLLIDWWLVNDDDE